MFKTKITFLKIQWSISTFCPTVFKNSPKCPNDDQMFGKTVNLTNEFRRTMPNDLVMSYGQNSLNLCTSQDWISKIVADIWKLIGSTDALQIFLLLYIHLKIVEHSSEKKKETISKDFSKLHPISWFFSLFQSFQSPATYLDKDQQLSVLEFDGCYDSCSTATISVGRIFTTLSIFDILLCRSDVTTLLYLKPLHVSGGFGFVK